MEKVGNLVARVLTVKKPGGAGRGIFSGFDPLEAPLGMFFVQATLIIGLCRFLGLGGQYLRQPSVIFEIIGGIFLGPSALCRDGYFQEVVFPAASLNYLSIVANIGLTFYLFIIGIELDTKLLMTHARRTAGIAIVGMAIPFCLGIAISQKMLDVLQPEMDVSFTSFFVFIGTAMSITAFPVLARILKEGGLIYTKPGAMTLGAAALNDAIAWCLLALAISVANGGSGNDTGYIFGTMVGIAAFLLLVIKPLLEWVVEYAETNKVTIITNNLFALVVCVLLQCAFFTELIGLDSIFGAFLFGLTIPRGSKLYHQCRENIEEFVVTFTLPLYFALSGLRTDVSTIRTRSEGAMVVLVCFCATIGKFVGAGVTAYFSGLSLRESGAVAALMNTRGLVELIVLNVGLSAGILNTRTFSVMVIMCLFTTFITSPLVSFIYPESMRKTAAEAEKIVEAEKDDNIELVELEREFAEKLELSTIAKKMGVVIESLPEMQSVIHLLSYFIPHALGSQFAVTAMHFIEPTRTNKDEFLGLNHEGRLIRVDEETTDFAHAFQIMEDPAAKKPELLPVSGYCKAHKVPVNAFRVEGDPIEYGVELKSIALNNECSLITVPFRDSQFARTLFWSFLHSTPSPVMLLLQMKSHHDAHAPQPRSRQNSIFHQLDFTAVDNESEDSHEDALFTNQPKDVLPIHRRGSVTNTFHKIEATGVQQSRIVMLLTGKHSDLIVLSLLPRFLENVLNHITVLIPKDFEVFHQRIVEKIRSSRLIKSEALEFIDIPSISTDLDGLYADMNKVPYDLLVVSFIEPTYNEEPTPLARAGRAATLVDLLMPQAETTDPLELRVETGMPAEYVHSHLSYPELGEIGSRVYESNHNKSSLILIVHEPLKVQHVLEHHHHAHAHAHEGVVVSQSTVNEVVVEAVKQQPPHHEDEEGAEIEHAASKDSHGEARV